MVLWFAYISSCTAPYLVPSLQATFSALFESPTQNILSRILYNPSSPSTTPQWADYPSLVNIQKVAFHPLLEKAAAGNDISLYASKVGFSLNDLKIKVKYSKLDAKEILLPMLDAISQDIEAASDGLQTFNAVIGGTIDTYAKSHLDPLHELTLVRSQRDRHESICRHDHWRPSHQAEVRIISDMAFEPAYSEHRRLRSPDV